MQERAVQSLTRPLMSREEAALRWRLALAKFIREHRVAVGMTQGELGDTVGLGSKQFVSGIETGRLSIPPERLEAMANAPQIGTREFAKVYLRYGNPGPIASCGTMTPSLGSRPRASGSGGVPGRCGKPVRRPLSTATQLAITRGDRSGPNPPMLARAASHPHLPGNHVGR